MAEHQSPVDIPADAPVHHDGLELRYRPTPCVIAANPGAVQVDCASESEAVLEGRTYALQQFHFHCPSEHTISGRQYRGALHLVHESDDAGLAVISVMLAPGPSVPALEPLIAALSGAPTSTIDPAGLVPADLGHVRYDGSLTTPPYIEGVAWYVLTTPLTAGEDQLAALEAVHRGNNRPVQPLNEREFL